MAQHTQPTLHQPQHPQQQAIQAQPQQQVVNSPQSAQGAQPSVSQQNNNYTPHHHVAPAYNAVHPGMYMQSHGMPQAMYPTMIPAAMPGNVYVHNVTANVNCWSSHPVQAYVPNAPAQYITGDVPQNMPTGEQAPLMQNIQPMPIQMNQNTRTPRRGRSRGGNNSGNRRNDYSQRQQQESPAPQEMINAQVDPQAAYSAPFTYQYAYPTFYGAPPQNMVHAQAAQQATGQPIYVASHIPMYPGPPMYNNYHPSGLIYPSMMPQPEYQIVDENGEERQHPDPGMMQQMWVTPMYPEEYVNPEMVIPAEDVNHNASPLNSIDTPNVLSPNYQIYDPQMQQAMEIQQQMNAMHIYEHAQGQHPPHMVHQTEEGLIECMPEQVMQVPQQYIIAGQPPQMIPVEGQLDQSGGSDHSIIDHSPNMNSNEEVIATDGSLVANINPEANFIPLQQQEQIHLQQHQILHEQQIHEQQIHEQQIHEQQIHEQQIHEQQIQEQQFQEQQIIQQQQQQTLHQHHQQQQQTPLVFDSNVPIVEPQQAPHPQPKENFVVDYNQNVPTNAQAIAAPPTPTTTEVATTTTHHLIQEESSRTIPSTNSNQSTNENHHHQTDKSPTVPQSNNFNNNTAPNQTVITKTMSWTNSQNKKTTASVAVTATPTSANKQTNHVQMPPQVKNYGVMKTPASPVSSNEHEKQKTPVSTTSTASAVVPQQLQPQPAKQSQFEVRSEVKVKREEVLNLAPPPASQPPAPAAAPSWASLFESKNTYSKSSASSAAPAVTASPLSAARKPIAKVAPYDGATQNIPPPAVTPGALSYSAASAQGIPSPVPSTSASSTASRSKATVAPQTPVSAPPADEWAVKFADFLTKYKPDFTAVSLRPRGLTNRSNYCYINSILQALVGCPPFYNLLRMLPKQSQALQTEVKTPTINAMVQFASEFSHLPPGARLNLNRREKVQKGTKDDVGGELQCDSAFEPSAIYKLWNATRSDVEGRQEDAEEFLGYVLNKLNDEMLEVLKLVAKPNAEENGQQSAETDDGEDWQMINSKNKGSVLRQTNFGKTPLSDIFRGELRSRLQREGGQATDVIQPFFTLQLNIEKAASVKEALEILVGRDQLEGVTCSKTNQEVVAWQQITLEKLPVVLILHLKWFDYRSDGCTKILKTVEFPVELKIDTKILASKKYSQKQRVYRLFAVVYHDGKEASKGHYITDVFHPGYSSWLRYDDSSVKPVSEANVLRPRAPRVPYLLYYRRSDTVASPPNQTSVQQHNNTSSK